MPSPRARGSASSSPRASGTPRGNGSPREDDAAWAEACARPPLSPRTQLIRAGAVAVSLCVLVMLRPELALAYRKLTRLPGQNDNLKRFLPPSRRRAAERQLRASFARMLPELLRYSSASALLAKIPEAQQALHRAEPATGGEAAASATSHKRAAPVDLWDGWGDAGAAEPSAPSAVAMDDDALAALGL